MMTERELVTAGTSAFAQSSHPEDEMFALVFNEHVRRGIARHGAVHDQPHPLAGVNAALSKPVERPRSMTRSSKASITSTVEATRSMSWCS